MIYAGIGSRKAPRDIQLLAAQTAKALAKQGWVLRSGHAPGMDQAFEDGAGGRAEIYLPWAGFEGGEPLGTVYESPTATAFEFSKDHHPAWHYLRQGGRALQARNAHQILGRDLATPSNCVICWTPDGATTAAETSPQTGGTGQAIRIASFCGITVYNLEDEYTRKRFERMENYWIGDDPHPFD